MKAGAVFRSFCWVWLLLSLKAEGDVTVLVSLHLSAAFWNLQPSGLYRFCTSFLFASCWDWKLKLKPRWRFRTARRNSAVSFKKIKKEVCWWLRDPDIRSYWKHTAGEHDCDVSGSLRCQLSLCNLVSSVSIFPIILIYDYDWYTMYCMCCCRCSSLAVWLKFTGSPSSRDQDQVLTLLNRP